MAYDIFSAVDSAFFAAIQHNPDDKSPYEAFGHYPVSLRVLVVIKKEEKATETDSILS
jgi:hypothetical protein